MSDISLSMKAGRENPLVFRCAELLDMFTFTDKMSQKRGLTQTVMSKMIKAPYKYSKLMKYIN